MARIHTRSLNGGDTRPLTDAAMAALRRLADGPEPTNNFNPGIKDRLTREPDPLATIERRPSPFKTDQGKPRAHLVITEQGRAILVARTAQEGS